ncbi:hypothetical protein ACFPMF_22960 [Larkinella bovis]|uniref:PKD domain-containing protein n=1 Tax=Larkinella bovis TaxID=683041 RepID=A0ABW0IH26_9BACT
MPVRKTESRIPAGLQPADLGQAVVATDNRCALVSYVTSPIVVTRENVYVVFVTDPGLAGNTVSYEWTLVENGGPPSVQTTDVGELAYTPTSQGSLSVSVRLLGNGNTEQAQLSLQQAVIPPNEELNTLLNEAANQPGPSLGSPEVLQELINEHNLYYQNVTPQTAEAGDGFKRFVFSMVYDGASRKNRTERRAHLRQLALSLNTASADFATLSSSGAGVCEIRPLLLSMILPGMTAFTLLPEEANQRRVQVEQLLQSLATLDEGKRIDLFNILRFPKSNIVHCGRILEKLRDTYFNTTNFGDVLTGMSGARSQWIIGQYRQGPIQRN